MDQHNIRCFKKKYFKNLQLYAVAVSNGYQEETIHQFRVAYKKYRTFIRLVSVSSNSEKGVKISKRLKYWYNLLGYLRDLQLQQRLIMDAFETEQERPQAYVYALEKEISTVKLTFSVKSFQAAVTTNQNKAKPFITEKISKCHCLKFVCEKLLLVHEVLLKSELSDTDFHRIRKNLKDIFYFLSMGKMRLADFLSSSIFNSNDDQYLKFLLEQLGEFQDLCTAIILLKTICFNPANLKQQHTLTQLQEKWALEKEQLRGRLVSSLIGGY